MDATANLDLPYIVPSQAQKHVTHNEAIRALDALMQLAVIDRDRTAPPATPEEGQRHLVAEGAEGAWTGHDRAVAAFQDNGWRFYTPRPGWRLWVAAEAALLVFNGSEWISAGGAPETLPFLGLNATADTVNRLTLKAEAALFDHDGGDHRLKINKGAAGNTASLLFQTGYSGRAEFGTAGDDKFRIKVSADGATWYEPMVFDPATGFVGMATDQPTTALHVNGALRVASYSKTALPAPAAAGSGAILHVWDEIGGSVLAFSDGGSWRRVTDSAVVS